ncbi:MAG: hypothetical protein KIS78_07940 [Labilithrix sp.]|nr:hypothetical protein [Labilithrix sp.]
METIERSNLDAVARAVRAWVEANEESKRARRDAEHAIVDLDGEPANDEM